MIVFLIAALTSLISCGPADELQDLIEKSNSKIRNERIAATDAIGNLVPKLTGDAKKTAAEKIISSVASGTDLVVSAAKLHMAEKPDLYNEYLGPFLSADEFVKIAQGCEAIKAIGAPARKWLPQLKKYLDKEERNFHLAALHALAYLEGKDIEPLMDKVIQRLESKDFNVQLSACRVLAKIGAPANKAGPKLVELLKNGNPSARSWASIALGAIGPHEEYSVVELLEERLDYFYLVDRQRALEGIAYLGEHAKPALPKIEKLMKLESKSVQHTASRTHWKVTGDATLAVDTLIKLLPTMEYGVDSMDILAEMGREAKKAVPDLMKQLKSTEAGHREAAVYALASIGADAKSAIEALKKMDKDEDVLIRSAAKKAVATIEASVKTEGEQKSN